MLTVSDPDIVWAVSISFVLVVCLAIVLLRDPYDVPIQPMTRTVWCEAKHRSVEVDLGESLVNEMVQRSVERSTLRGTHETGDDACYYQPMDQMRSPR